MAVHETTTNRFINTSRVTRDFRTSPSHHHHQNLFSIQYKGVMHHTWPVPSKDTLQVESNKNTEYLGHATKMLLHAGSQNNAACHAYKRQINARRSRNSNADYTNDGSASSRAEGFHQRRCLHIHRGGPFRRRVPTGRCNRCYTII
jgi:hypothetical protein